MESSWWERLTEGETGSYGLGYVSNTLMQFSVDGQGCVPSLLFDLRPNCGGGSEDNGSLLQKVPCTHCCTQCPQPWSRPLWPTGFSWRLLDTHGQVWVSLLWGHCSFLLGSLVHKSLFVPSKSVPLVLCKFWWLSGSVNGDLLQEGLYHTRSATSRPPAPAAGNWGPVPL